MRSRLATAALIKQNDAKPIGVKQPPVHGYSACPGTTMKKQDRDTVAISTFFIIDVMPVTRQMTIGKRYDRCKQIAFLNESIHHDQFIP